MRNYTYVCTENDDLKLYVEKIRIWTSGPQGGTKLRLLLAQEEQAMYGWRTGWACYSKNWAQFELALQAHSHQSHFWSKLLQPNLNLTELPFLALAAKITISFTAKLRCCCEIMVHIRKVRCRIKCLIILIYGQVGYLRNPPRCIRYNSLSFCPFVLIFNEP